MLVKLWHMKQSHRITCRQILVSLVLFMCLLEFTVQVCPAGFFGRQCHYKCLCGYLNCYDDGNCWPNASCYDVYFGPACQYINNVNVSRYSSDWVHDNNDSTCNPSSNPQDITVRLKETTFMTWLRIHFQHPHRLGDAYQAVFVKLNGTVNCLNKRIYMFRTGVIDVSCDNILIMSSLVVSGTITTMLCNIFVSGGRNVIYRQNTTVIGVNSNFTTERPVDGNTYCQIAFPEVAKRIFIDVPNPHLLYRVLIYMRYGTTTNHDFLMQMYSGPNITASRTVRSVAAYTVKEFMFDWSPFTRLSIQITPQVEICEVQATGETWCDLNKYGYECEHTCQCLPNEICFPPTGMCGPECPPGSYGFLCSLRCGNCQTNKCDYRTGKCKCNDGYKDDGICLTPCSPGTYGYNCTGRCSGHCRGTSTCDRVSGNCTDCADGYFSPRCHLQCPAHCLGTTCHRVTGKCASCANGYFGENCTSQCPDGCLNSICDFTKGSCTSCKATRFGVKACASSVCTGTYLACHQNCSVYCLNRLCNMTTGKCVSCAAGWEGPDCTLRACPANCKVTNGCNRTSGVCTNCKDGFHGPSCQSSCPSTCNGSKCHQTTAHCLSCRDGYFGVSCTSPCPTGCFDSKCSLTTGSCYTCKTTKYGTEPCPPGVCQGSMLTCRQTCNTSCLNQVCNQTTGKCIACAPGYTGPPNCALKNCPANCRTTNGCNRVTDVCNDCKDGYFGPSCQSNCSRNCLNGVCNKTTGHCSSCLTGYFGPSCQSNCSRNCLNGVCNKATGHCSSCLTGYFGPSCQFNCSRNCLNGVCNKATGHCSSCQTGYYSLNCSKPCLDGCLNSQCNFTTGSCLQCKTSRFGTQSCPLSVCQGTILSCHSTCSAGCLNDVCNQDTGVCGSCKPGYVGPTCTPRGCPVNCDASTVCDNVTGICRGCLVGFWGPSCQFNCSRNCLGGGCGQAMGKCSSCEIGYFDTNCSSECPVECLDSTCDFTTGGCLKCQPAMFGSGPCRTSGCNGTILTCNESCSVGCANQTCDPTSGICAACIHGFEGPTCIAKGCPAHCTNQSRCDRVNGGCFDCADGYFGSACQFDCPKNCKNHICIQESGECIECEEGYFDRNCSQKCPKGCLDSECNVTTGECFLCKTGMFGERNCMPSECQETILVCNRACSEGCLNGSCNQSTGVCFACAPDFEQPACTIDKDSGNLWWLLLLIFPLLLLCIILALCYKKSIIEGEEETKVSKGEFSDKDPAIRSPGSSWTFATSYVMVSRSSLSEVSYDSAVDEPPKT